MTTPLTRETCRLSIDGEAFDFEVEGEFSWGEDEILYRGDGVLSQVDWRERGFGLLPVFTPAEHRALVDGATRIVAGLFDELGYAYPADFRLEDYHRIVTTTEMHQSIITRTRLLVNRDFPIAMEEIAARLSQLIGRKLLIQNPLLAQAGVQGRELVTLRISRPRTLDINPPHRDGYLPYYKPLLNCWIPIAGCDARSSLPVMLGSHLWNERGIRRTPVKGAKIDGLGYHVPAIIETSNGMAMTRPNPKPGEILAFTPFLIHGAAVNWNDATRAAFELRLFDEASGAEMVLEG